MSYHVNVEGQPFTKEAQFAVLVELLSALQKDTVELTSAVFESGEIRVVARIK